MGAELSCSAQAQIEIALPAHHLYVRTTEPPPGSCRRLTYSAVREWTFLNGVRQSLGLGITLFYLSGCHVERLRRRKHECLVPILKANDTNSVAMAEGHKLIHTVQLNTLEYLSTSPSFAHAILTSCQGKHKPGVAPINFSRRRWTCKASGKFNRTLTGRDMSSSESCK